MTENSADRQLDFALESLFDRKVAENRTSRRFWPAIQDRLGGQVSRRPWEYVMDALKMPGLAPIKPQYMYTAGGVAVVVVTALLFILLLNTDDGSNGGPVPAESQEQLAPEGDGAGGVLPVPTNTPVATATSVPPSPTPQPTAITVPAAAPEPAPTVIPEQIAVTEPIVLPDGKPLPVELHSDSTPLDSDEAIALWTEYLSNTTLLGDHSYRESVNICGDGTGFSLVSSTAQIDRFNQELGKQHISFDWFVAQGSGYAWNEVLVRMTGRAVPTVDLQRFRYEDGDLVADGYDNFAIVEIDECQGVPNPDATPAPEPTQTPFPASNELPAALQSDSTPLGSAEVIDLWTTYLSDTEVVGEHSSRTQLRLCDDGTGFMETTHDRGSGQIVRTGSPNSELEKYDIVWEVLQTSQMWNEVTIRIEVVFTPVPGADVDFPTILDIQRIGHRDGALWGRDYDRIAVVDTNLCA